MPSDELNVDVPSGKAFKFGQTTLEGHALAGEESFAIRWRPDNSVWYVLPFHTYMPFLRSGPRQNTVSNLVMKENHIMFAPLYE